MQLTSTLAQLPASIPFGLLIPIFSIFFVLVITVVAILTSHQQKMAKLIHGDQEGNKVNAAILEELVSIRSEMAQLKDGVNQKVLADDSYRTMPTTNVVERLNHES
jgi:parvulin-like peptidyl-prolyl isomerase